MALKQEEFDKLTNITKKKVLINMTGVRQTIASNPNPQVLENRHTSIRSLVTFTRDNWIFLNDYSKELLSQQLQGLLKVENSLNFINLILGNP